MGKKKKGLQKVCDPSNMWGCDCDNIRTSLKAKRRENIEESKVYLSNWVGHD